MSVIPSNRIRSITAIQWTPIADQRLTRLRTEGASMRFIAKAFGLSRSSITERARRLGLNIPTKPVLLPKPPKAETDPGREPLPAGHQISWGLITAGTCLEGAPYTPPSPHRGRISGQGEGQ